MLGSEEMLRPRVAILATPPISLGTATVGVLLLPKSFDAGYRDLPYLIARSPNYKWDPDDLVARAQKLTVTVPI